MTKCTFIFLFDVIFDKLFDTKSKVILFKML